MARNQAELPQQLRAHHAQRDTGHKAWPVSELNPKAPPEGGTDFGVSRGARFVNPDPNPKYTI